MDGGSGVAVVTDAGGEEQACMAPPFTLREFNRKWARRVLAQGAHVLMMTDGLDLSM